MGLKPLEVKALTYKEFNLMLTGYARQQEQEWNRTRHIMAYTATFGGMGAKEFAKPQDIWPLQLDKEDAKIKISTLAQARMLLKEFKYLDGQARISNHG